MKKYFWFVECVMLFACLAFGGCTEEGDAISTLGASEKKHVGYWTMGDKAHGVDGADIDRFAFLDIPLVAQLHLGSGHNKWVAGLGPVFSFCVSNDNYYIDGDPNSPLNGKDKIKDFSLELQPSVMYEVGKFRFGMEGLIGLLDIKRRYPQTSGSIHMHSIMATVGFNF